MVGVCIVAARLDYCNSLLYGTSNRNLDKYASCPDWRISPHADRRQLEMDRSSANAELRPKNSAKRSARFGSATCELFGRTSAELQQKFGVNFAVLRLRRFALI